MAKVLSIGHDGVKISRSHEVKKTDAFKAPSDYTIMLSYLRSLCKNNPVIMFNFRKQLIFDHFIFNLTDDEVLQHIARDVISGKIIIKGTRAKAIEKPVSSNQFKFFWILDNGHGELTSGHCSPLLIKNASGNFSPLSEDSSKVDTSIVLEDSGGFLKEDKKEPVIINGKKITGYRLYEWEITRDIIKRIISRITNVIEYGKVEALKEKEFIPEHINGCNLVPSSELVGDFIDQRVNRAKYIATKTKKPKILISVHTNGRGLGNKWYNSNNDSGVAVLYYPCGTEDCAKSEHLANIFKAHVAIGSTRGCLEPRTNIGVIKRTSMPAILTENGFHTNIEDCKKLLSRQNRNNIAQAHVNAMVEIEKNWKSFMEIGKTKKK